MGSYPMGTGDRLPQDDAAELLPSALNHHDNTIEQLRRNLETLRIPRSPSGRLRVALRRRYPLRRFRQFMFVLACAWWVVVIGITGLAVLLGTIDPSDPQDLAALGGFLVLAPAAMFLGVTLAEIPNWRAIQAALRYTLVMQIDDAIAACATAHRAGGERAAQETRSVGKRLAKVARGIERAHRRRGTVPRRSHRNRELSSHERLVIGALWKAESRLDTSPAEGLRDLAELLLTIAERYAHARIGALLDNESLQDIEPKPDRGLLRWVTAVVLGTAAVVGVALLNVPPAAEPYIISGVLVISMGLVSGPSTRRAIDIIDVIRSSGGP